MNCETHEAISPNGTVNDAAIARFERLHGAASETSATSGLRPTPSTACTRPTRAALRKSPRTNGTSGACPLEVTDRCECLNLKSHSSKFPVGRRHAQGVAHDLLGLPRIDWVPKSLSVSHYFAQQGLTELTTYQPAWFSMTAGPRGQSHA